MRKKAVKILWGVTLGVIVLVALLFTGVWYGIIGYMPDMEEMENPVNKNASEVYSAEGKFLEMWTSDKENRQSVGYEDLPKHLVQALIATEDERFMEHSGIDFKALGRAIVKRGVMGESSAGGGSTITQQLAKQLYSEHASSSFERLVQKPVEWVIAIKLERHFTKEEILTMYLNYFDFLHNAVGIKMAGKTYFNRKVPKDLTLGEAATLVGLCKNPSYFNPIRYKDRCRERRNVVLQQMVKSGYITQEKCNEESAKPLDMSKYNQFKQENQSGNQMYFTEMLRKYLMAKKPERSDYPSWDKTSFGRDSSRWVNDPQYGWCNKNFKRNGEPYNIYTDGLKVYTTLDTRMQKCAEEAVWEWVVCKLQPVFQSTAASFMNRMGEQQLNAILRRAMKQSVRYNTLKNQGLSEEEIEANFHKPVQNMEIFDYHSPGRVKTVASMTPWDSLKYDKEFVRAAFVSMDAHTGAVRAYVPGTDYKQFSYDMCMEGRRQVGSTIKPYLYALALENGMTPCSEVFAAYKSYPGWGGWKPKPDGPSNCNMSLKRGLQISSNAASAALMSMTTARTFMDFLETFGVHTYGVLESPMLCVGHNESNVCEMTAGYTAFTNKGVRCLPLFVTKITDKDGNVVGEFQPITREVISEETSYGTITLMQGVINGGTGSRLRGYVGGDLAGKTGTTNNQADGWFIGYSPQLVNGCWVGGDTHDIRFASMAYGQGASAALPVWGLYMKRVYANAEIAKDYGYSMSAKFDFPEGYDACNTKSEKDAGDGIEEEFF